MLFYLFYHSCMKGMEKVKIVKYEKLNEHFQHLAEPFIHSDL